MELRSTGPHTNKSAMLLCVSLLLLSSTVKPIVGLMCSEGWELCPDEQSCIPSGCRTHTAPPSPEPGTTCPEGKFFCPHSESCVAPCSAPRTNDNNIVRCSEGKKMCANTGECVSPDECFSGEDPFYFIKKQNRACPEGYSYCIDTGGCVMGKCTIRASMGGFAPFSGFENCPTGSEFCVASGGCVQSGRCGSFKPNFDRQQKGQPCSAGMVFCVEVNRCLRDNDTCSSPKVTESGGAGQMSLTDANKSIVCPIGQVFCMSSGGRCVQKFNCSDSKNKKPTNKQAMICWPGEVFCPYLNRCKSSCPRNVESLRENATTATSCPPNTVFCVSSSSCMSASQCLATTNGHQQTKHQTKCPRGQVFCLQAGRCVDSGQCGGRPARPSSSSRPSRPGAGASSGIEKCREGQTFCFSTGRCQDDYTCLGRPRNTFSKPCPYGMVYCTDTMSCILTDTGCSGSMLPGQPPSNNGAGLLPTDGQAKAIDLLSSKCDEVSDYCVPLGNCSSSCRMALGLSSKMEFCPKSPADRENSPFSFSNCRVSSDCPLGYSCCADEDTLLQQCINSEGKFLENNLNYACGIPDSTSSAPVALDPSTNLGFSVNKSADCPASSIFCKGSCYGDIMPTSCVLPSLYCTSTQKCERIGSLCEEVCTDGLKFCTAKGECLLPDQCEFDLNTSGAPWTMPSVLLGPRNLIGKSASIEQILSSRQIVLENAEEIFEVTGMVTEFGSWEKEVDGGFTSLNIGDKLPADTQIRFKQSPMLGYFGAAWMNITESSTNIERLIVQLIAPSTPRVELHAEESYVKLDEDEELVFSLGDAIKVFTPPNYWNSWQQSQEAVMKLLVNRLIDFESPATEMFVELLDRPDKMLYEVGEGIDLKVTDMTQEGQEVLVIAYKRDVDKAWRMLSKRSNTISLTSARDAVDTQIKVLPVTNRFGNVSVGIQAVRGGVKNGQEIIISLEVKSKNDAPMSDSFVDCSANNLKLNEKTREAGFLVSDMAGNYFRDSDGDPMGMAIIYAQVAKKFGEYQYSDGGEWISINDLIEKPFKLNYGDGCIINFDKMALNNMCKKDNLGSTLQSFMSSNECKEAMMTERGGENNEIAAKNMHLQNVYSKTSGSGVQLSRSSLTNIDTVHALFLPPNYRLRYNAKKVFSPMKGISKTNLVFYGWDQTNVPSTELTASWKKIDTVNLAFTSEDLGFSLSQFPAHKIMEWEGCEQSDDSTEFIKKDVCGVCGGNGTSCLDCHGVVDGTAKFTCGVCYGGETSIATAPVDCANQCFDETADKPVCEKPNALMCDGQNGSNAYINECGVCVLGNTGRKPDYMMDRCGVCSGPADRNMCLGCDGVPNSGKIMDKCEQCLLVDDPQYDQCEGIGAVTPSVLDMAELQQARTLSLTSGAETTGLELVQQNRERRKSFTLKAKLTKSASRRIRALSYCSLKAVTNETLGPAIIHEMNSTGSDEMTQRLAKMIASVMEEREISSTSVTRKNRRISASFGNLEKGFYHLNCSFISKKNETFWMQATDVIEVINSFEIDLTIEDEETPKEPGEQIKLSTSDLQLDPSSLCVIRYTPAGKEKIQVERMQSTANDTLMSCQLPHTTILGNIEVCIVLNVKLISYFKTNEMMGLPCTALTVEDAPPKLLNITYNPKKSILKFNFDSMVQLKGNCNEIVENGAIFGTEPKCKTKGSKIILILGADHDITNGTSLMLSPAAPGGVVRWSTDSNGPVAEANVPVHQLFSMKVPVLRLVGDTEACNGSDVVIRAFGLPTNQHLAWNITHELDEETFTRQQSTLDLWDNIRVMQSHAERANKTLTIPGELFLANVSYLIVASPTSSNGDNLPEPVGIPVRKLSEDKNLVVRIKGTSKINIGRRYVYKAMVKECGQQKELAYIWSLDGDTGHFKSFTGRKVRLDTSELMGNRDYVLNVIAYATDDAQIYGSGSLSLSVNQKGIVAAVSSSSMKAGIAETLRISAKESKDLDNWPGDLTFMWTCNTLDGDGCFIPKDGNEVRLESLLTDGEMMKPVLSIPSGTFIPGDYILTVTVSKDNREAKASTNVEMVAGSLPIIYLEKASITVLPDVEELTLKSSFTADRFAMASWTSVIADDSTYIELTEAEKTFPDSSFKRPSYLEIKGPLEADAMYKFKLEIADGSGKSYAEMTVKTVSELSEGNFEVSPLSGYALETPFCYKVSDWKSTTEDQETPLSVTYGYTLLSQTVEEVWVRSSTTDNEDTCISLPVTANGEVVPMVRVCDIDMTCTEKNGSVIILETPEIIKSDVMGNITEDIMTSLSSETTLSQGIREFTVMAKSLNSNSKFDGEIKDLFININTKEIAQKLSNLAQSNVDMDIAYDVLSSATQLVEEFPSADLVRSLRLIVSRIKSISQGLPPQEPDSSQQMMYSRLLAAAGIYSSGNREIYFPDDDMSLSVARNGGPPPNRYSNENAKKALNRPKRSTADVEMIKSYTARIKSQVESLINTAVLMIQSDPESEKVEMDSLIEELDQFSGDLCLGLGEDSEVIVENSLINLKVLKSQLTDQADTLFTIGSNAQSSFTYASFVVFGPMLNTLKNWDCGAVDPVDGLSVPCYGACIATVHFSDKFQSPSALYDVGDKKLRSNVVKTEIRNPSDGSVKSMAVNEQKMEYSMSLNSSDVPQGKRLKCFYWLNDQWDGTNCNTGGIIERNVVTYQKCHCPLPGYVAVFEVDVPTSGGGQSASVPSTGTSSSGTDSSSGSAGSGEPTRKIKHVKFFLDEDYDKLIGDDPNKKLVFITDLKLQLANKLNIHPDQIIDFKVYKGSIVVEFAFMEDSTIVRSLPMKDVEVLYEKLNDLLQSGQLQLANPDSSSSSDLNIPVQSADGSGITRRAEQNKVPMIIGGVLCGLLVVGALLMAIAVRCKNKKRKDVVSPLQNEDAKMTPSYRSIHFSQGLDDSAVKKTPQYGDLDLVGTYADEGVVIERHSRSSDSKRSTDSAAKNSRVSSGLGTLNEDEDVPDAFRYKSPTHSQMQNTQEIPANIQAMLKDGPLSDDGGDE